MGPKTVNFGYMNTDVQRYQHIIVPTARSTEQQDCPGGILADDMGLGKSLSILSAIMASKTRAIDYTMSILGLDRNSTEGRYPCAATLIVVPSACTYGMEMICASD